MKFIFGEKSIPDADVREALSKDLDIKFLKGVGHLMLYENYYAFNNLLEKRVLEF